MLTTLKIRPAALRWGLAGLNFLLLMGFSWQAWSFFVSDKDELEGFTPPDTETLAVRTDDRKKVDHNRVRGMLDRFYAEPPKKRVDTPKVELPPMDDPQPGGPLEDWRIISVLRMGGEVFAFVEEGGDDEGASVGSGSRMSSRSNRRSGRRRSSRRARGPRTRTESMVQGETFRDDNIYIEAITADPDTVVYVDTRTKKRHTITRELEVKDYTVGLVGDDSFETDDKSRASKEQLDEADKGRIETKKSKKKNGNKDEKDEDTKKAVEKAVDPKKDEQK